MERLTYDQLMDRAAMMYAWIGYSSNRIYPCTAIPIIIEGQFQAFNGFLVVNWY